jgi:hypothetical protein
MRCGVPTLVPPNFITFIFFPVSSPFEEVRLKSAQK